MSACKLVDAANKPHIRLLGAQPAHSQDKDKAARQGWPCSLELASEVKHGEWLLGLVYLCDRSW